VADWGAEAGPRVTGSCCRSLGRAHRGALAGHQAIVVRGSGPGARTLAFFGDLCMRPWSANPRWVTAFDDFPLDSVAVKGELFRRAVEDGWLVALSHEIRSPVGRLVPDRTASGSRSCSASTSWMRIDSCGSSSVIGLRGDDAHLTFEDAVAEIPGEAVNLRPPNTGYTLWQLVEHLRISQRDMLDYVRDPGYVAPEWPVAYWPDPAAEATPVMFRRPWTRSSRTGPPWRRSPATRRWTSWRLCRSRPRTRSRAASG